MSGKSQIRCNKCGLPYEFPGIAIGNDGNCNLCNYDTPSFIFEQLENATKIAEDFIKNCRSKVVENYHCILMLSGGKDSINILKKLLDENFKVLAYTYRNPFESKAGAKNVEHVIAKLKVDHIFFSDEVDFTQYLKRLFTSKPKGERNFLDNKRPCVHCTRYNIITTLWLAYQFKIPYVVYCADPIQSVTFNGDINVYLPELIKEFGETILDSPLGRRAMILKKAIDNNEINVPKVVYPYVLEKRTYDPLKIINDLRTAGLYEGSPTLTHCELWPLLNYYTIKLYNSTYYLPDFSVLARRGIIDSDFIKHYEETLLGFFKAVADDPTVETNTALRAEIFSFFKSFNALLEGAETIESSACYFTELLISAKTVAAKLGITLDNIASEKN